MMNLAMLTPTVTGGLGGLGVGLIRAFLYSGADVVVTDMATKPPAQLWGTFASESTPPVICR
jgi:NAD(P)-dependent dehydrogenase (short-subunit alcohol dehydrogenase family)